jgi:hypothetical protein
MKTIITTLPIYDKKEKQCYERSQHATNKALVPIICPRYRLPSFQWLDGTDGASSVSKVELCDATYDGTEEAMGNDWNDIGYATFNNTALEVGEAMIDFGTGAPAWAYLIGPNSTTSCRRGTQIRIIGTLTMASAPGTEPSVHLDPASSASLLASGVNNIILLTTNSTTTNVFLYNHVDTKWELSGVSVTKITGALDITSWFSSLPSLAHDYFSYDGTTLNYLMEAGEYYLKITMDNGAIYYSEWFEVDCVYDNLVSQFDNVDYNTFSASGTVIVSAIEIGGIAGRAVSNGVFTCFKGEEIEIIFFLTQNSGQLPTVWLLRSDWIGGNSQAATVGLNDITLTATIAGSFVIRFSNSVNTNYSTSEIIVIRKYSTKYLTLNFSNVCDLGDIYYHGGFDQTVWFESEPMEISFPMEEDGAKNGEGRFVRSFARQEKKYIARTMRMPDYMVDVFNRMRLHDTIELIDLLGNENYVYNLEVEHEWMDDDKYYVRLTLTFDYDEAVVISGCCNNIT